MKIKLEKWYIDFTSEKALGFYYIMCVSLGPIRIGLSGINHFGHGEQIKSLKFSRLHKRSIHALKLKNADYSSTLKAAHLKINHGSSRIQGTWLFLAPPQKRPYKPLYRCRDGWCDWKVWTPKAEVNMKVEQSGIVENLKGTGYIDYVRFDLPAWRTPLRRLYWGRMHSPDSWSVFMCLNCADKSLSLYMDPQGIERGVSVHLNRGHLKTLPRFIWNIGNDDRSFLFEGKIVRTLEKDEILAKNRHLKILPPAIRQKLNSFGIDEKFEIKTDFRGNTYHGIMEEVSWNA